MAVYVCVRDPGQIRARMTATRMTQAALARATNTSGARISQLLSGHVTTITVSAAAAIEQALDVPRGELFVIGDPAELVQPYVAPRTGAA